MPRGDRTGPFGMGPMTGRGLGYCAGFGMPGFANFAPGWGVGPWFGRGGGRGWRHWYFATGLPGWARVGYPPAWAAGVSPWSPTPEQEKAFLRSQAENLKAALADVEKRLADLEGAAEKQAE